MDAFKSVPPWEIVDNQIFGFRSDLGLWFKGLLDASTDDTLPFAQHCLGMDADVRSKVGPLVEFLGRVGDHRLAREHRRSAELLREFLASPPLPAEVAEEVVPLVPPVTLHNWQRALVRLKKGLREAAAQGMERRARKHKNRSQLQITVPKSEPEQVA